MEDSRRGRPAERVWPAVGRAPTGVPPAQRNAELVPRLGHPRDTVEHAPLVVAVRRPPLAGQHVGHLLSNAA